MLEYFIKVDNSKAEILLKCEKRFRENRRKCIWSNRKEGYPLLSVFCALWRNGDPKYSEYLAKISSFFEKEGVPITSKDDFQEIMELLTCDSRVKHIRRLFFNSDKKEDPKGVKIRKFVYSILGKVILKQFLSFSCDPSSAFLDFYDFEKFIEIERCFENRIHPFIVYCLFEMLRKKDTFFFNSEKGLKKGKYILHLYDSVSFGLENFKMRKESPSKCEENATYFKNMLKILVHFKCDLSKGRDGEEKNGYTVLMSACVNIEERIVGSLLEIGGRLIDIKGKDKEGRNIFILLAKNMGDHAICNRILHLIVRYAKKWDISLGFGLETVTTSYGMQENALTIAKEKGNTKFAAILMENCAGDLW